MERADFRSIGRDAQVALRQRAVHLVLHEGMKQGQAARAKREKAVIYWSDETGVCNQDQIGRG